MDVYTIPAEKRTRKSPTLTEQVDELKLDMADVKKRLAIMERITGLEDAD